MTATVESSIEQRVESLLGQLTLREKVGFLSGVDNWRLFSVERLGIPALIMTDGPHGVRADRPEPGRPHGPTTFFPTGVSMAASWNPALIERVGVALGAETRAMGCDILLGPCVNIVRAPLAGRNFEAYSEDPYLAGRIGVGWVKGVQSQRIGASLKHYAANNCEIERNRGDSVVDERTLREIYLPQFEMIVKETQPWTVMCSYNRINGVYASQHDYLLNQILKGEWGLEGFVVSDWGAVHTIFESVQGGMDLEMPGPARYYGELLMMAIRNWQIEESVINAAVRRILGVIIRSGRMDAAGKPPSDPLPAGAVNTPEHQALARELAEESITLLKNDKNALPLAGCKTLAVIGPNATVAVGGGGSSHIEPAYRVSPLEGLQARLGKGVKLLVEPGCDNWVEAPALKSDYLTAPDGAHGLKGEYFANRELAGEPILTQVDAAPDFRWIGRGPHEKLTMGSFSARWTGKLAASESALESGRYTLGLRNTGKCKLYINGECKIEGISEEGAPYGRMIVRNAVEVELAAGKPVDIKVEYIPHAGQRYAGWSLTLVRVYAPGEDQRLARAVEAAKKADAALLFVGMPEVYESEGNDRPNMALPGAQDALIAAVAAVNPRTIVVLNAGAPVAMPWANKVAAILLAYFPGQENGHAVARLLMGDASPSGKLSVSWPKRLEDNPAYLNSSYNGLRKLVYGEGIFVGYRYYDRMNVEPLFPFGHGLSYTTFGYSALRIVKSKRGAPVRVSVRVKNTGSCAGSEVVQLYVRDVECSVPRPPKELKGFVKLTLQPGETQTATFDLDERAFAFYDPDKKQWTVEPGEFEILIGSSSRDIRVKGMVGME